MVATVEKSIRTKIESLLKPIYFELENESHTHSVPRNSETHFRAVIVSEVFKDLSRVERQRRVLEIIEVEMKSGVHAFTMRCLAPAEWSEKASSEFVSPPCHGGSKKI